MEGAAGSVFSASASLIAGYSFLRLSYCRRFLCARLATDRYALHVLSYSFVFFVLGEIAAGLIPYWTPSFFALPAESLSAAGFDEGVINAIVLAIALAVGDNLRVHWLMRNDVAQSAAIGFLGRVRRAAVERFICGSKDAAVRMIFRATVLNKQLVLTLKSHKVYVGLSYLMPWDDPTQDFAYIKIFPTRSGFRDAVTKEVTLTECSNPLLERLLKLEDAADVSVSTTHPLATDLFGLTDRNGRILSHIDINDLGVVIAWSEVESLGIYDERVADAAAPVSAAHRQARWPLREAA